MEKVSFEMKIKELEQIIKELDNKDIELEKAVNLYTKGAEVLSECEKILNENQKLVIQKMTESGLEDFNVEGWLNCLILKKLKTLVS